LEARFLKVEDIARDLDVKEDTVREWLRKKLLVGYKFGKEYRIKREDYEAFLAQRRTVEGNQQKT
jgi:excisionase family DNA binding protein